MTRNNGRIVTVVHITSIVVIGAAYMLNSSKYTTDRKLIWNILFDEVAALASALLILAGDFCAGYEAFKCTCKYKNGKRCEYETGYKRPLNHKMFVQPESLYRMEDLKTGLAWKMRTLDCVLVRRSHKNSAYIFFEKEIKLTDHENCLLEYVSLAE